MPTTYEYLRILEVKYIHESRGKKQLRIIEISKF